MKIALVYDRVNKFGGAERVLEAMHEIWPEAPLFTAVYDSGHAAWAKVFHVKSSFLQYLPFAKKHHEIYPWLTPLAFESFNFDEFDIVISVTSAEAKTIITKPETLHVCYCLTPTRYLWSGADEYLKRPSLGLVSSIAKYFLDYLAPTLRRWDLIGSSRPDNYLAISDTVKQRIKKYYYRQVEKVICPPVDLNKFKMKNVDSKDYFLTVSRLVGYKRLDIIIDAFNELGWPLVIIGDGLAKNELKKHASGNIRFIDVNLTDDKLVDYYQSCRAFVFAGVEDFGLVGVEAQACGKPVIAYDAGGMSEIVKDKLTGILYKEQTKQSLIEGLHQFSKLTYNSNLCRNNAERFSLTEFKREMRQTIEKLYQNGFPPARE